MSGAIYIDESPSTRSSHGFGGGDLGSVTVKIFDLLRLSLEIELKME
jgi:hypothetical protein